MDGTTVAVDLAERVFEVAVANERGQILDRKRYGRASFQRVLETWPPSRVAMEACSTAHHWGRLRSGTDTRLYTQHRVRRPNVFEDGLWAGSGVHITAERAGSDITPEHFSDTSPALRPAVRPDGPRRRSPVSRSAPGAPRSVGASTRTSVASGAVSTTSFAQ